MKRPRICLKISKERLLPIPSDEEAEDKNNGDVETNSSSSGTFIFNDNDELPPADFGANTCHIVIPLNPNHSQKRFEPRMKRFGGSSSTHITSDEEVNRRSSEKRRVGVDECQISSYTSPSPERTGSSVQSQPPLRILLSRNGNSSAYVITPISAPSTPLSPPKQPSQSPQNSDTSTATVSANECPAHERKSTVLLEAAVERTNCVIPPELPGRTREYTFPSQELLVEPTTSDPPLPLPGRSCQLSTNPPTNCNTNFVNNVCGFERSECVPLPPLPPPSLPQLMPLPIQFRFSSRAMIGSTQVIPQSTLDIIKASPPPLLLPISSLHQLPPIEFLPNSQVPRRCLPSARTPYLNPSVSFTDVISSPSRQLVFSVREPTLAIRM